MNGLMDKYIFLKIGIYLCILFLKFRNYAILNQQTDMTNFCLFVISLPHNVKSFYWTNHDLLLLFFTLDNRCLTISFNSRVIKIVQ